MHVSHLIAVVILSVTFTACTSLNTVNAVQTSDAYLALERRLSNLENTVAFLSDANRRHLDTISQLQSNDEYFVERDGEVRTTVNNQKQTIERMSSFINANLTDGTQALPFRAMYDKLLKIRFDQQPSGLIVLNPTGLPSF